MNSQTGSSRMLQPGTMPYQSITPSSTTRPKKKSTSGDDDARERNDESRKVDLADQVGVGDEPGGAAAQGFGEVGPRQHGGEREHRIGQAVRGKAREDAEDDGEDEHREQRLHDRPGHAERGLLVADLHVAPDQDSTAARGSATRRRGRDRTSPLLGSDHRDSGVAADAADALIAVARRTADAQAPRNACATVLHVGVGHLRIQRQHDAVVLRRFGVRQRAEAARVAGTAPRDGCT